MSEITFRLADLLTVGGAVALAVIIGLWAKNALPDWRWTPWVVLVATTGIMVLVQYVVAEWHATSLEVMKAILLALVGSTLESWGYEAVVNALGAAGWGHRSEEALLERAKVTVARAEFE